MGGNFRKRSPEEEQSKRNKGNSGLILNILFLLTSEKHFSLTSVYIVSINTNSEGETGALSRGM